jgi:hypothetical protein
MTSDQHMGPVDGRRRSTIGWGWTGAATEALRPLLDGASALLRALDPIGDPPMPAPVPVRSGSDAYARAAAARHARVAGARRPGLGWDRC